MTAMYFDSNRRIIDTDMARHCSVCDSAARDTIDRELLEAIPFREIAARYGVSTSALNRHRTGHLDRRLVQVHDDAEMSGATALLAHLRSVELETERLAALAEAAGDLRTALAALRERTRIVELKARIAQQRTMPVDQALKVIHMVAAIVRRHVTDPRVLIAIRDEIARYPLSGIAFGERLLHDGDDSAEEFAEAGTRLAPAQTAPPRR